MLRNEICRHCKYKRFTCPVFRCDPYKEAKLKQRERWWNKYFPIEDYDGEDRYVAGLLFAWAMGLYILVMMVMCVIKVIEEWW